MLAAPYLLTSRRRALNVGIAVVLLLMTLPLMAVIALLVLLSSRGSTIFRQTRIGRNRRHQHSEPCDGDRRSRDLGGMPFEMLKFRSMQHGAGATQVWAAADDTRVTPVGRVLRRFRLDELPQLVNILRGEMNLVGPRPEQPSLFAELREKVEGYPRRQLVLPGITGLAQVSQGADHSIDDVRCKLAFDLDYISRRTPREDLRIMVRTLPVMLGLGPRSRATVADSPS
ncbi:MAG: sugar transferase [Gemmatimonadota bacterium]